MDFLITLAPLRPGFPAGMTAEERAAMDAHFHYLKALVTAGSVVLAGPVLDPAQPNGLIVIETADAAEAGRIMADDPSVKAGLMRPTLQPFRISLLRGRMEDRRAPQGG